MASARLNRIGKSKSTAASATDPTARLKMRRAKILIIAVRDGDPEAIPLAAHNAACQKRGVTAFADCYPRKSLRDDTHQSLLRADKILQTKQ